MIFGVAALVAYISRFMTLEPGDLITTGTPPGVGMGIKPTPVYLRPGDLIKLGIERLGESDAESRGLVRPRTKRLARGAQSQSASLRARHPVRPARPTFSDAHERIA